MKKPIKIKVAATKKALLGPPIAAQTELFHVEKQTTIDGVEMGVLENGIPYLSESGLGRMCGRAQRMKGTSPSRTSRAIAATGNEVPRWGSATSH